MTEFILIIIGVFLLFSTIFILTHLRPLTDDEIKSLAGKRRKNQIRFYYSFNTQELSPNKEFKKRMNSSGKFYNINETLYNFPSTAAALLKYKKHEWIIMGFEKDKRIDLIWLNKGFDRASVSSYLSLSNITYTAKSSDYTSVLIFHNHPNINPNYYDCRKPSDQDLKSARDFMQALNSDGINLLEFVCERGKHYEYFLSAADIFSPLPNYLDEIIKENDQSKLKNLSLHFERVFQI